MKTITMALTVALLTAAAAAQPASFTDLGIRTATQTFTQTVTLTAANDIQWFRMQLPAVAASGGWVDIWALPTANPLAATDLFDPEMGLYNAAGSRAVATPNFADDNDGPGSYPQLSFGSTVARPAITFGTLTPGAPRAGVDGALEAGVYYLAVGAADTTFANTGFGVTSTHAGARRTTLLNFDILNPTQPFPPTAVGAASLGTANAGDTLLYTVTVVPGGNPTSTGITVVGNLTPVGGPVAAAFLDDGLNGDSAAGDNVFSFRYTIPLTATDTTYSLTATATDAQGRTAGATINGTTTGAVTWDEMTTGGGDAGQTIATAQVLTTVGSDLRVITGTFDENDIDIYKLSICAPGIFTVTTRFSNPLLDTQLFLFEPDGTGVVMNDDVPSGFPGAGLRASTLNGDLIVAPGNYYLAAGRWNIDPHSSLGAIWADQPFNTLRAPDGVGAAGSLNSWVGTADGGVYRLTLTGACFPISECGPADIGSTGGVPGPDGVLDNNDFIVFVDYFFGQSLVADVGSTGGVAIPDQNFDNNDFIVYIDMFFSGSTICP